MAFLIILLGLFLSAPASAQRIIDNFAGGTILSGIPAQDASINSVDGLACDPSGNIVFSDAGAGVIRRIRTDGMIETIAGIGVAGTAGDDGPATSATLTPTHLAYDSTGNLYLADVYRIRKITRDGIITTVAGTGIFGTLGQYPGPSPFGTQLGDGSASIAQLGQISGLASDQAGNLYFSDTYNGVIRRLTPEGSVERVAGRVQQPLCNGVNSGDEGPATEACIAYPTSIAIDPSGNLYVASSGISTYAFVRKITPDGIIHRFAGSGAVSSSPSRGSGGPAFAASLFGIGNIAAGSDGRIYLYESQGGPGWLWQIDGHGTITAILGPGNQQTASSNDGPSSQARLSGGVADLVVDPNGNLILRDGLRVRRFTTDSLIQTLAGGAPKPAPDGVKARDAWLVQPNALARDGNGNVYIVEGCLIRKVDANGTLTTFAGTGSCGTAPPRGPKLAADLPAISSIVADSRGRIFFIDSASELAVIALDGTAGAYATLPWASYGPVRLAIDSSDIIYVAYTPYLNAGSLFEIDPDKTVHVLLDPKWGSNIWLGAIAAGTGPSGGFYYVDARAFTINRGFPGSGHMVGGGTPASLTVGSAGDLWCSGVAIGAGPLVHQFASNAGPTSVALGVGIGTDGVPLASAHIGSVTGLLSAPNGDLYFIDQSTNRVRIVHGALPAQPPAISGIANAVSLVGPAIAPGELISIFGSNLGPTEIDTAIAENNQFGTSLNNVTVFFDGIRGVIAGRTSNQINVFVPHFVNWPQSGTIEVVVDVDGLQTQARVKLAKSAFGLATADQSGSGQGAILNQDSSYNSAANPAARGSVVTLFGTGEGDLDPPLSIGALVITTPYPKPTQPVKVSIGGQDATVLYAGEAPFLPSGVLQLNAQIPTGIPPGSAPVIVSIGDSATTGTVTVAVR